MLGFVGEALGDWYFWLGIVVGFFAGGIAVQMNDREKKFHHHPPVQ